MSAPAERQIDVNGQPCRVWEKGEGPALGYFAGLGGLSCWTPFLDRLAETRRVIVPSLPGFPGGRGHERLDDLADWISATLDLLEGAELAGADLVGASIGGALAAEVAAFAHALLNRLVLLAPLGLFEESEPTADVWAQRPDEIGPLLCARPEAWTAQEQVPEGEDELEWRITRMRASEAAARLLWPTGDLGLRKRLHRIQCPTLLVWGTQDRVVPASYAKIFSSGIAGPSQLRTIDAAGHLVDFDAPDAVAEAVLEFLSD